MRKFLCAAISVALAASGCGTLKPPRPLEGNKSVERIEQAASLHTSITSIAPWEDIKEKLRPGFTLSPSDALSKSIPTTLVRLDRVLDILRFQLALTPGITRQTSTTTSSSGTGKDPTTTTDSKTEKSSPELPTATPPSGLGASAPASTPAASAPDSPADALLQYQTAANLLRDIAVLNAEIDNVSKRTGQDAFLTRIQITVMPLQHGLGYDTYANISLFGAAGGFDPQSGRRTAGGLLPAAPLVVPILSTDSVQVSRRSVGSTAEREVGLALSLLKGFGSVGASFGRDQQTDSAAAGNDLESVVTVGRLSDNTIRIRMGADPLPGGGYGIVPRTFNISAVVFLPKQATQLYYVSRLSMHHVLDGSELSSKRIPDYGTSIERISEHNNEAGYFRRGLTKELLETPLDDYAFHGDVEAFHDRLAKLLDDRTYPLERQREEMYLWADLIALNGHSRFASSVVDVPRPLPVELPSARQLVAYSADEKGVSVTLGQGKNIRAGSVGAQLLIGVCPQLRLARPAALAAKLKKTAANDEPSELPCRPPVESTPSNIQASSVTPSVDGSSVTILFPPIDRIVPLSDRTSKVAPLGMVVYETPPLGERNSHTYIFTATTTAKADSADKVDATAAAIIPESRVVASDKDRKGWISFFVQGGGKKDLRLLVHQSVVSFADDTGKPVPHKGPAWEVTDGTRYILSMANLFASSVVQIELVSQADASKKATPLFSMDVRVEESSKK